MLRRLFIVSWLAFSAYILWPYDVWTLRTRNPKNTSLIRLRIQEARDAGRKLRPRMTWVALNRIAPALQHAVLLSEDDTFYRHSGFDIEQIEVAIERNLKRGRFAYGGSTITQQLARTLYLRPRKSLVRKAKEAALTIYLESTLSKRRILELYLNVVEWGPGIFGAEAASRYYFWKPAEELTTDEAIALASILPSPRRWSPYSEKAYMAQRRTRLLERMQKDGYNTETDDAAELR